MREPVTHILLLDGREVVVVEEVKEAVAMVAMMEAWTVGALMVVGAARVVEETVLEPSRRSRTARMEVN